jgi:hypothetical protein
MLPDVGQDFRIDDARAGIALDDNGDEPLAPCVIARAMIFPLMVDAPLQPCPSAQLRPVVLRDAFRIFHVSRPCESCTTPPGIAGQRRTPGKQLD